MTTTKTKKARKAKSKPTADGSLMGDFRQNIGYAVAQALQDGRKVSANELTKELNCSYPTVWQALRRLHRAGKIERVYQEPKDGIGRGEFVFKLPAKG